MINKKTEGHLRRIYSSDHETPNRALVLIVHGAGAGLKHEFMESYCENLAKQGIVVWSFNFPYMQQMYELDKRRPPNKLEALIEYFQQEITAVKSSDYSGLPLFIAGKSMGGRVASLISSNESIIKSIVGVIALGYPFVPPGKPEKYGQRTVHFSSINHPLLILQGERDNFGNRTFLEQKSFPSLIKIVWIISGDHSFKPLKRSGLTINDNIKDAVMKTNQFINNWI